MGAMASETIIVPVLFRAEKSGDFKGDVTAVFPTLPGTNDPWTMTCYAHVGQHGTCSKDWYWTTRAAKPAEYAPLLAELKRIYENDPGEPARLKVVQRLTPAYDRERRAALRH